MTTPFADRPIMVTTELPNGKFIIAEKSMPDVNAYFNLEFDTLDDAMTIIESSVREKKWRHESESCNG